MATSPHPDFDASTVKVKGSPGLARLAESWSGIWAPWALKISVAELEPSSLSRSRTFELTSVPTFWLQNGSCKKDYTKNIWQLKYKIGCNFYIFDFYSYYDTDYFGCLHNVHVQYIDHKNYTEFILISDCY